MAKVNYENEMARKRKPVYNKPWFIKAEELYHKHLKKGLKVADVGCGTAEFSEIMRDRCQCNGACFDISHINAEKAREKGFIAEVLDLEQPDEKIVRKYENTFDVVFFLAAIEHIFDVDSALQVIHRLLKKDGCLIISTPNVIQFTWWKHHVKGGLPWKEGHHVRFFDLRRLKQYLFLNSFDVIDENHVYGTVPTLFWKAVNKFFLKSDSLRQNWTIAEMVFMCRKKSLHPIGVAENYQESIRCREDEEEIKKRIICCYELELIAESTRARLINLLNTKESN